MPPSSWKLLQNARLSYRATAVDQREARRRAEFENTWLRALVRSTSARAKHVQDAFERHIVAAVRVASLLDHPKRVENPAKLTDPCAVTS